MELFRKINFSKFSIFGLLLFTLVFFNFFKGFEQGKTHPFKSDAGQYYSYLVATFIHDGDLAFSFPNNYWLHEGPKGILVQKMSVGVAMMETPFFLIGHWWASLSNKHEANGYTDPYSYAVSFGVILYVFLGLLYLRKTLLHYYSDFTVGLTLIALYMGSNLYFYTVGMATISHSFLFALISFLVYSSLKWTRTKKAKYFYISMLIIGLAAVTRPTHILSLLFFVLVGVNSWSTLKEKIKAISGLKFKLIIGFICLILPIIPQLAYWKFATGNWIYFSYVGERFFWKDPKIVEVLVGWRKGWFLYTPLMLFPFIGLFFIKNNAIKWASIVYFGVSLYVISCWWCWWYGGSYGSRIVVDYYALMAFPLAAIIQKFDQSLAKKAVIATLVFCFMCIEFYGIFRFRAGVFHYDAMTKESYIYSLTKFTLGPEDKEEFLSKIKAPDYDAARKGDR